MTDPVRKPAIAAAGTRSDRVEFDAAGRKPCPDSCGGVERRLPLGRRSGDRFRIGMDAGCNRGRVIGAEFVAARVNEWPDQRRHHLIPCREDLFDRRIDDPSGQTTPPAMGTNDHAGRTDQKDRRTVRCPDAERRAVGTDEHVCPPGDRPLAQRVDPMDLNAMDLFGKRQARANQHTLTLVEQSLGDARRMEITVRPLGRENSNASITTDLIKQIEQISYFRKEGTSKSSSSSSASGSGSSLSPKSSVIRVGEVRSPRSLVPEPAVPLP
jgi:hypothetical protein